MTRFMQEINGNFGEWWKDHAEKEVIKKVKYAKENAIVDEYGAIKWKSNGRYLMDDYCEMLEYANYPFSRTATQYKRDKQVEEELRQYREANANREYSEEELYEMECAFGKGTTVVDIITGKEVTL